MSNDISHAFDHPEHRAAVDGGPSRDRISVRDMVLDAEIGAFQAERGTTQRLRFNIVVEVMTADQLADDVDRILSYDRITEAVEAELQETRLNLLETLAANIADRILTEPQAGRVFIRIEKLDRGPGNLGVEIERRRLADRPAVIEAAPRPRLLFLQQTDIVGGKVADMIDAVAGDAPLIICVGAPAQEAPQSAIPQAQRRIDLLAIEQLAWVLAGTDARCVVVDSRTELDWGMKHGQISVWAPSKIVLDAHDAPLSSDPQALTIWLAEDLGAVEIVTNGKALGGAVSSRSLVDV